MGEAFKRIETKMTYKEYLNLPEGERVELIDGYVYNMVAPSRIHQEVSMNLSRIFSNFLLGKECKVYAAPFDVRLIKEGQREDEADTVVQPDLSIICDKSKLDERGCKGAPDMIIEIVSPSTASIDYIKKLNLYEKFKVKEYWIVNPIEKIVIVFCLIITENMENLKFMERKI
ncbi:Uma2 family endonuclease [Caloramator sp. Dgby_cultured_2]|uniref:Uma2 family endonuclease n=1 Tax=Caloramator sp. Dgby_cultured_2 TaxID=3029174 RepID=UPI0031589EA7